MVDKAGRAGLGWRLIGWAWALLLIFCWVGLTGAREMVGRFGRGLIEIRHWMDVYNTVVLGAHLLVLVLLVAGVGIVARATDSRRIARLLWRSCAAFLGAALFALAMLCFVFFVRTGPWPQDAIEVRVLRLLVFAPSLLRAIGWVFLVLAMVWLDAAGPRWLHAPLLALALLDAGLSIFRFAVTPRAVVAVLQPQFALPWAFAAWTVAGALFFVMLRRVVR